ncbi:unnamed protein product [Mytilus coruscus]|uniref:Uncharacterized protein n=1 Tax=Mytilus coruscus TaxID=42192 RepID=A0A6J8AZY6_MYTCO|nr:unnamed protein product [Mytilus coruscus]
MSTNSSLDGRPEWKRQDQSLRQPESFLKNYLGNLSQRRPTVSSTIKVSSPVVKKKLDKDSDDDLLVSCVDAVKGFQKDPVTNATLIVYEESVGAVIHNKLDSALEGLDINIFSNHHDDSVIFQKKRQTTDDCDNDTTIPYVDDHSFYQSSPIHSQINPFVTPRAKPTLPTSIRPLRPSIVQKPVIPSSLSNKPAPVAVNPLLQTPQQFASLYPKLPTSTSATASIA